MTHTKDKLSASVVHANILRRKTKTEVLQPSLHGDESDSVFAKTAAQAPMYLTLTAQI